MKYKDLPVGAKFFLGSCRTGYDKVLNDLVWTKVTESGKAVLRPGILGLCFDGIESYRAPIDRANHGWNAYFKSNVHQYLNSTEDDWYKPAHDLDECEYSARKKSGFLSSFSEKERKYLVQFDVTQHTPAGAIKQFGRQVTETVFAALPAEIEFSKMAPCAEEGELIPLLQDTRVFVGWTRTAGSGVNKARFRECYGDVATDTFCNRTGTICPMIMISDKMPISDTYDSNGVYHAAVQNSGILSDKIMDKYLII